MFKSSLFGSKVAQRILASFVLAALIPIIILGLLSFQQVREQLREQSARSLQKSCKDYGMVLIDRLTILENTLRLVAIKTEKSSTDHPQLSQVHQQELDGKFASLAIIQPHGVITALSKDSAVPPELSEPEITALVAGKTLLKAVPEPKGAINSLWMAINLTENHPEAGILIAKLKADTLWMAENIEPNQLWVISGSGDLLDTPEQSLSLSSDVNAQVQRTNSGQFKLENNNEVYLGAYWKLPLGLLFFGPDLIIVQAQAENMAFAAIRQFSAIYPPVILLAILIVAYLSTRLINKYLTPLAKLKTATLKIAEGDLSHRLNIHSHDEFETLACSFNEMTRRLGNQFDILAAMAEIDRHILSALNADDIVETALTRLPDVLGCELIVIAKINLDMLLMYDIRTRRIGHHSVKKETSLSLSQADISCLLERQHELIEINSGAEQQFSGFLHALGLTDRWQYLLVPVCTNGQLSSLIGLGYPATQGIPAEARNAARNFGDRIAVALSNAAWEEKLYRQAHYDSLTGLPNRLVLYDRLEQELGRANRDQTQLALFFIDLDRFKNVNDSLGHSAGDELLAQVAQIFVRCVRETDLVVRIGGDEFVVVISDIPKQDSQFSLVTNMAENILAALNQRLLIAGQPMTFTASIGIAIYPTDADTCQDLLKNADAAMYHAKQEGRANFRFYSPELNASALENIQLEHELRNAIANEQLLVFYQAKVDLHGRIVGAEALIRWLHPERGMISPVKFIPIAEQTGLIVEIGCWVLEQTCLAVNAWHQDGLGPIRVSVNLSAIEFKRPDLVEKVASILVKTGVDPDFIELELTESVAVGDVKTCVNRMLELKGLGLMLTMDDFGTGFSSLSYLKDLPLDVLKIDQSFIRRLESDRNSEAIVLAILALAKGLGMETVAEGVETEAQLAFLKQSGCEIFQGYLFSRPVGTEDFIKLLKDDARK